VRCCTLHCSSELLARSLARSRFCLLRLFVLRSRFRVTFLTSVSNHSHSTTEIGLRKMNKS
jgi:hypothetical protein